MKKEAQPKTGQHTDQTGHVHHAGHDSPKSRFAYLADVRVRRTVVEAQAEAHGQRGHEQHGDRSGLEQHDPTDDAGHARQHNARFIPVLPLHVTGHPSTDRLAQEQYASCE